MHVSSFMRSNVLKVKSLYRVLGWLFDGVFYVDVFVILQSIKPLYTREARELRYIRWSRAYFKKM